MPINDNAIIKHRSKRSDFILDKDYPYVADKIKWNGSGYIKKGPLFCVNCDVCGESAGLRTSGDINRTKRTGSYFACSYGCRSSDESLKICKQCKSEFRSYDRSKAGSGTFCSKPCYTEWQKSEANQGPSHPSWDPRSDDWLSRTKRPVYVSWRKSVFIRDNYICQRCKQIGGKLHAHHIKAFWAYPELELELNNGITLCNKCHWQAHQGPRRKEYPINQEAMYAHS